VSRTENVGRQLPATLVRARVGRSMKKLHRQDPDSDEPQPKCRHADGDHEYGHVDPVVYPDARQRLCQNPGCFGDREGSQ
jgi:hypothetical protein